MKKLSLVELSREEEMELRGGERDPLPPTVTCVCFCPGDTGYRFDYFWVSYASNL